jgi:hypothetical protein
MSRLPSDAGKSAPAFKCSEKIEPSPEDHESAAGVEALRATASFIRSTILSTVYSGLIIFTRLSSKPASIRKWIRLAQIRRTAVAEHQAKNDVQTRLSQTYDFERLRIRDEWCQAYCGHGSCRSKGEPAAWIDVRACLPRPDVANAGLRADGYMRRSVGRSAGKCRATLRNGHDDWDITSPG